MTAPNLTVAQVSADRAADGWRVVWRIRNNSSDPVVIASAWLPHGRFHSQEWRLDPPLRVPVGGEATLPSTLVWRELPGTVVENGFLILRLDGWRVFARLTITAAAGGAPHAVCQAVTIQAAG